MAGVPHVVSSQGAYRKSAAALAATTCLRVRAGRWNCAGDAGGIAQGQRHCRLIKARGCCLVLEVASTGDRLPTFKHAGAHGL